MRQFLALELPEGLRAGLGALQETLRRGCAGWRWTAPEGIHLTLRFLGDVDPKADPEHRAAWRRAAAGFPALRLRLAGTGVFPGPRRPRVLWVGIEEVSPVGALARLAEALEQTARGQGFAPEPRPFRPHLTLARAKRDARPDVPASAPGACEAFACAELVLFRSDLSPRGARYAALERFPLAGSA